MSFYTKSIEQALLELESSQEGLSKSVYAERLAQYGKNQIYIKGEPLWQKIIEPFRNIFMAVLFAAVIISILHDAYVDAWIISAIMAVNSLIYYVQRFSTERILRSLQKRDKFLVDVIRDGESLRINAEDLVPGDIIILDEGEKIPADARLITVNSFRVDESQLTGESLPIQKNTDSIAEGKEVYEQSNMVFQGSFVVGGHAVAVITATGNNTEFGRLAALSVATPEHSPVQIKIDRLITQIIRVISAVALIAFGLSLYRGVDVADSIRYVLALSVSAVPESLAVAITVVLVLGMRRMAAKKALVRAMRAIETVGTVTTIATDKTGTLTENKLTVQRTWHLPDKPNHIITALERAVNHTETKVHDPLDSALMSYVSANKKNAHKIHIIQQFPFSLEASMSGNVVDENGKQTLWLKGAPEKIIEKSSLTHAEKKEAEAKMQELAGEGYRVIALAHTSDYTRIETLEELPKSEQLQFDGFSAVADILRTEAKQAIKVATNAGITVRMITGDHFETAFHIGKELGMIENRSQVFDSRKMHKMSDEELEKVIDDVRVFARVIPEHKHRILILLKKKNITAMTGDGVNDVPALTGAHVGVAMGSGASIAKDAGDIILLDDNFRSIVNAIHEGRTIYSNIKRMVAYLISTNAGEVFVALSALIAGIPVPLAPVQILWVNLATDTCMVIPLGLEPGEKRNMNKPPQAPNAPLFSKFMISRILLVSTTMAILTMWLYVTSIERHGLEYARTMAFHALVVMQWASAFNYRSDYESLFLRIRRFSPAFYLGLTIAVSMQIAAMLGVFTKLLHLTPISIQDILYTTFLAFIIPIFVVELHKLAGRKLLGKGHSAKVIKNQIQSPENTNS